MNVTRHRFTVEEYHKMGEAGIFSEDDRVELIVGETVEMAPIGDRHVESVMRLNRLLSRWTFETAETAEGHYRAGVREAGLFVSVQNPVTLAADGELQFDLALVLRSEERTGRPTPEEVLLIVEFADTSLEYDRETKLPRYARADIPEAWLVDLRHDIVEVYTDPTTQGYGTVLRARPGEVVPSSVVRPQILADEILPANHLSFRARRARLHDSHAIRAPRRTRLAKRS
jgi:Uma2 family endonuclease